MNVAVATFLARRPVLAGAGLALLSLAAVIVYAFFVFPARIAHHTHLEVPEDVASALKAVIALTALGFVAYEAYRRVAGRPMRRSRVRLVLAGLAALSVAGYLNFGDLGYPRVYHRWELFHYYLGAKYHEELGYTRLYAATAVAESELGPAEATEVAGRSLRNLETDTVEPTTTALAHADEYRSRFSSDRWESFRRDVAWFRSTCDASWWSKMQIDHGYNPAPLWTVEGSLFARIGPASDGTMRVLASLDLVLFAAAFAFVGWAFGWRTLCLTLVFWGTQWPANFVFTWGAFLRQDWVFYLLLAAAMAKRRRYGVAGAALAASTLVRVFPVVFFVPVVASALFRWREVRSFPRAHLRFLRGALLGFAALLAVSAAVVGPRAYPEFVSHIQTHGKASMTNLMGAKTIAIFDWNKRVDTTFDAKAADGYALWSDLRASRAHTLAPLLVGLQLASLGLVVWAARRRRAVWALLPCGLLLVMSAGELTNYYYAAFLLSPLLAKQGKAYELYALGAAAASALLMTWGRISASFDTRCYFQSWVFLALALLIVAKTARASA